MKYMPDDILREAADMYDRRNSEYAAIWRTHGETMVSLFPDGLTVRTAEDWTRLHLLILQVVKVRRYSRNFENGGHRDSAVDGAVYWAMADALDRELAEERGSLPDISPVVPPDSEEIPF